MLTLEISLTVIFKVLLSAQFYVHINTQTERCQVSVPQTWEKDVIFTPPNSTIQANCTAPDPSPELHFFLPGDLEGNSLIARHFGAERDVTFLNSKGFYELSPVLLQQNKTLRVRINGTDSVINGTVIRCQATQSDRIDINYRSTITVIEPIRLYLNGDIPELHNVVNISWTLHQLPPTTNITYTFRVIWGNAAAENYKQVTSSSSAVFIAPEGAPVCEVYNISVTASYDFFGTINTENNNCNIPSPVLSMMLPSLPDKKMLELSVEYFLNKESVSRQCVQLRVMLLPLDYYCDEYPITNYTLVVQRSPMTQSTIFSVTSNETSFTANSLPENMIYWFKISATNIVGTVSTDYRKIYTTDVQNVTAIAHEATNTFTVECVFIIGSDAQGCLVVLIGQHDNYTEMLTRNNSTKNVTVKLPQACYQTVLAFDVESNGSVASLAIFGEIVRKFIENQPIECTTDKEPALSPRDLGLIVSSIIIIIVLIVSVTPCAYIGYRHKCSRANINSDIDQVDGQNDNPADRISLTSNEAYYELSGIETDFKNPAYHNANQ